MFVLRVESKCLLLLFYCDDSFKCGPRASGTEAIVSTSTLSYQHHTKSLRWYTHYKPDKIDEIATMTPHDYNVLPSANGRKTDHNHFKFKTTDTDYRCTALRTVVGVTDIDYRCTALRTMMSKPRTLHCFRRNEMHCLWKPSKGSK